MKSRILVVCLLILFLPSCAVMPVPAPTSRETPSLLIKLAEGDNPLSGDDLDMASLEMAVSRSLRYLDRGIDERYRFGGAEYTTADIREGLLAFRDIIRSPETIEAKLNTIRACYDVYKAAGSDGKGSVVFTGYYEPVLNGSLEKTQRYRYPLYRPPPELAARTRGDVSSTAYLSRAEIDGKKALASRGLEIAWVDDPVALFFLHIQGSGIIRLPDDRTIQVSYARSNNRPFRSIGRYMAGKGILSPKELSNRKIKAYLRDHPDEQAEILHYNERYIFFRIVPDGPIGALGVTVTGGRTIAIDPDIYPKAGIAYIRLRRPVFDRDGTCIGLVPFSRFVLGQDVGAAIKGPGRIDLFCGGGADAETLAGNLKERGELYFLVKKKAGCSQVR